MTGPYRDQPRPARDDLVQSALRLAISQFADMPSCGSTHDAMAKFMVDWFLREHGLHALVGVIQDVGPTGGGITFKVYFQPTVSESRFRAVSS